MKKSGFTMIELIFVIVILGILAAVAVPKLNATRADAEKAKAAANISTLMSDFYTYHTSQGKLAASLQTMTNVGLSDGTEANKKIYKVANQDCLEFARLGDNSFSVQSKAAANSICSEVLKLDSVKSVLTATNSCKGNGATPATLTAEETAAGCDSAHVGTPVTKNITEKVGSGTSAAGVKLIFDLATNGIKW